MTYDTASIRARCVRHQTNIRKSPAPKRRASRGNGPSNRRRLNTTFCRIKPSANNRTKMFHVNGTIDVKRIHARLAQNRWIFAQASSSTAVAVA
jgi:hypothetical protein